jgi:hypothetical protein
MIADVAVVSQPIWARGTKIGTRTIVDWEGQGGDGPLARFPSRP